MWKRRGCVLGTLFLLGALCGTVRARLTADQEPSKRIREPESVFVPIAIGKERISRENRPIEILQGKRKVIIDYFTELVIATMTDEHISLQSLSGKSVILTKDLKQRDRWIIFRGGVGLHDLILTDNAFRIQKVLAPTRNEMLKVQVNSRVYQIRAGQVLFVLG